MSTASCKSITPDTTTPTASSSLKGIYDDTALLRLAKVSSDETNENSTYRFETCHPSGNACTGAFRNAQGQDVLISFKQIGELEDLSRAEYLNILHNIDDYYPKGLSDEFFAQLDLAIRQRINNYNGTNQVQKELSQEAHNNLHNNLVIADGSMAMGAFLGGTGIGLIILPMFGRMRSSVGLFLSGLTLTIGGGFLLHHGDSRLKQMKQMTRDVSKYHPAARKLPYYLNITDGLTSRNPSRHKKVTSDSSVYWLTFALGQELNISSHQSVVKSVCFMNNHGQEVCENLNQPPVSLQ